MRGKCFGYKQINPCPNCNSPRVLEDCDDDAYVYPGVLHPAVPPSCKFTGWENQGVSWWVGYKGYNSFKSTIMPGNCPVCNCELVKVVEKRTMRDKYSRTLNYTVEVLKCKNSIEIPAQVENLQGCKRCREYYGI